MCRNHFNVLCPVDRELKQTVCCAWTQSTAGSAVRRQQQVQTYDAVVSRVAWVTLPALTVERPQTGKHLQRRRQPAAHGKTLALQMLRRVLAAVILG
jgi:hypothetical protein